jgi:hypothetical protein
MEQTSWGGKLIVYSESDTHTVKPCMATKISRYAIRHEEILQDVKVEVAFLMVPGNIQIVQVVARKTIRFSSRLVLKQHPYVLGGLSRDLYS